MHVVEPRPRARRPAAAAVDARALALELARELRGEVRFSAASRALYANDASVYRQLPIGVVIPRSAEDVVAAVEICRRHGAPLGARGCGTGLAGQTVNTAVLLDFSKYRNEILELDPERRLARVQPGVVLDWLRDAAERHELTFGPDPATHSRCTLGGMIGNNSCGTHSIMAGVTADNIEALDVLLYDGTRLRLPSAVSDEQFEAVARRGGREGEIYRALRDLRDRYAEPDPRALSADPAPDLRLQPRPPAARAGLQPRRRARGHRGHVRAHARGPLPADPEPPAPLARAASATRTARRPPTRCRR